MIKYQELLAAMALNRDTMIALATLAHKPKHLLTDKDQVVWGSACAQFCPHWTEEDKKTSWWEFHRFGEVVLG